MNTASEKEKRANVSNEAYSTYLKVRDSLRERGVTDFTFSKFIDMILSKTSSKSVDQIIDDLTPKKYRMEMALKDESLMDELLKIVESREKKRLREKPQEL